MSVTKILNKSHDKYSPTIGEAVFLPGKQVDKNQSELFNQFYKKYGNVVIFVSKTNVDFLIDKLKGLNLLKIAPSFGSIDHLVEIPSIMSHFGNDDKYFESIRLERNLIRLSVGCESSDMIIDDLNKVLYL